MFDWFFELHPFLRVPICGMLLMVIMAITLFWAMREHKKQNKKF